MGVTLRKWGWYVYYRKDGKLVWEPFGHGAEAEARARKRNDELGLGKRRPPAISGGPTFLEIALSYLWRGIPDVRPCPHCRARVPRKDERCPSCGRVVSNPRTQLRIRLEAHLLPAFGARIALQLRPADVAAYVAERREAGAGDATIARELTDLKAIFSWAAGTHKDPANPPLIPSNPLATVKKPKVRHIPRRPPTKEETLEILAAAEEHVRRSILLNYYLGCRAGPVETFSLRWNAVRWEAETILVISANKGGIESREVAIHPELLPLLKAWWKADGKGDGYIVNWRGKRIKSIKHAWAKTLARVRKARSQQLGVELEQVPELDAVPYSFRHHFVTQALERGADIGAVAKVTGTSPATLQRFYQHVSTPLTRQTVNLIEGLAEKTASKC